MALFGNVHLAYSQPRRTTVVNRVYSVRQPLPNTFKHLHVLCNGERGKLHALPCKMDYKATSTSATGHPVAVYQCSLCGTRQGLALHRGTGKTVVLFHKAGKHN